MDDLATALGGVAGMEATKPVDVAIYGFTGTYVELCVPLDAAGCGSVEPVLWETVGGEGAPSPGIGDRMRLWILDVEGTRLVIGILGSLEPRMAEAQAIVDSVRIER